MFYRPSVVHLPPRTCQGPGGAMQVRASLKLYPIGALSVTLHVPFEAVRLDTLVSYYDLRLDGEPLAAMAQSLARRATDELMPHLLRPVETLSEEEAYTVFCLASSSGQVSDTTHWLMDNRRPIASLLNHESDPDRLSDMEVADTIANYQAYGRADLLVTDWDAALLLDTPADFGGVIHTLELANVQLVELRVYDRMLDSSLQKAYQDLARRPRAHREVLATLREIRVDLARLGDELSNVGKLFGDWHLAKIYRQAANLLHLDDWRRTIAEKLSTLDSLYQLLKQEQLNRSMAIMELAIVVFFIIDLVLVAAGMLFGWGH